jgi:predicted MPP superfamily phosphohydrolase
VKRRLAWVLLALLVPAVVLAALGWQGSRQDVVVRRATVALPGWPPGEAPITLLLMSDTHASWPSMTPERLRGIVARLNRLDADAILIAGDMVSTQMLARTVSTPDAIAPLGTLRAPLGVYAVFGNHDHWRGVAPIRRALRRTDIVLLENRAVRVGPVTLGGVDDPVTDHADLEGTTAKMAEMGGPQILLSHGTSLFDWLPVHVTLMLAGHTHCGQVRFLQPGRECGLSRRGVHRLIVGAGIGTSILPFRIGAPPDVWLITVGPPAS